MDTIEDLKKIGLIICNEQTLEGFVAGVLKESEVSVVIRKMEYVASILGFFRRKEYVLIYASSTPRIGDKDPVMHTYRDLIHDTGVFFSDHGGYFDLSGTAERQKVFLEHKFGTGINVSIW